MVLMMVCVGGSVGVLMRSLGVGMAMLECGWCVFGGVGGWVSEFWTSGRVNMLIITVGA